MDGFARAQTSARITVTPPVMPPTCTLLAQGRIQGFPKGGVETCDTKCGGGGGGSVLSALDPTRKAGGGGGGGGGVLPFMQARYEKRGEGGAFHLRPDTKSGGGGGGGGGAVRRFRPDTKSGEGRGAV